MQSQSSNVAQYVGRHFRKMLGLKHSRHTSTSRAGQALHWRTDRLKDLKRIDHVRERYYVTPHVLSANISRKVGGTALDGSNGARLVACSTGPKSATGTRRFCGPQFAVGRKRGLTVEGP